jgi:hypothetical protein
MVWAASLLKPSKFPIVPGTCFALLLGQHVRAAGAIIYYFVHFGQPGFLDRPWLFGVIIAETVLRRWKNPESEP